MSYLLKELESGWAVDQAILAEEDRLVVRKLKLLIKINKIPNINF